MAAADLLFLLLPGMGVRRIVPVKSGVYKRVLIRVTVIQSRLCMYRDLTVVLYCLKKDCSPDG